MIIIRPIYYSRNQKNSYVSDIEYLNSLIKEAVNEENYIISSVEKIKSEDKKSFHINVYNNIINDSKTHLRILDVIYGNLNGSKLNNEIKLNDYTININDLIYKNVLLSKKYRKLLYSLTNKVHKYMMFDLIIDLVNNNILLDLISEK